MKEAIPFYEPGDRITGTPTDAAGVVARRFVKLSAALDVANGHPVGIVHAAAGNTNVLGVATYDMEQGGRVAVIAYGVVPVEASAALTFGAFVAVAADGKAAAAADRTTAVGLCMNSPQPGADAAVKLLVG